MSCERSLPVRLRKLGFELATGGGRMAIVGPVRLVPGGDFWMGSNPSIDSDYHFSEQPQSVVTVPTFGIGCHPITMAEYECAVLDGAVPAPRVRAAHSSSDHPVVGVGWVDAVRYAEWLSDITRQRWSLPTEAQWEKAAKGTDHRRFPWGDDWASDRANTWESKRGSTTAIGSYEGLGDSPYGIQDMAGNVWEWCSSQFRAYPYDANDGREELRSSRPRVLRGGAWRFSACIARVSYRYPDLPGAYSYDAIGFRLCRVGDPA